MIFAVRILQNHEGRGYAPTPRLLASKDLLDTAIQGGEWDIWETTTPMDDSSEPKRAIYVGRYIAKPPTVKQTKGKLIEAGKVK